MLSSKYVKIYVDHVDPVSFEIKAWFALIVLTDQREVEPLGSVMITTSPVWSWYSVLIDR